MTLYLNTPLLELPLAGEYEALMMDPPWRTQMRSKKGLSRSASRHYPTMKLEEIRALPVRQLAAKNCWVMLWTTPPHLRQALGLLDSWGATYSSILFTWVKLNPRAASKLLLTTADFHRGTGYTSRKNTELCLLAKFGRPKVLKSVDELIIAARRQHSRKPDMAFSRALEFCQGPHLEVFSRETRAGWDTWGNEAGKFDAPALGSAAFDTAAAIEGYKAAMNDIGRKMIGPQLTAEDDFADIPAFLRRLATEKETTS